MNEPRTLHATLYGAPDCRRYKRTRQRVLEAATATGARLILEEVNDTATLARFNPVTLPRLEVEGKLLASRNPPSSAELKQAIEAMSISSERPQRAGALQNPKAG